MLGGDDLTALSWHERVRVGWITVALVLASAWGVWQFLQGAAPRRIVLASGPADSVAHEFALRYKEILGRDGVRIEERLSAGGAENAQLLHDPGSGVDVAFTPAGVATAAQSTN